MEQKIRSAKTAVLLVNTRSKKGRTSVEIVANRLRSAGYDITDNYKLTQGTDLHETMKSIMKSPPTLLVVGSGDGTVSAVSGYLANSNTALGYIPLGTTNNFGRSLGLPMDTEESVNVITKGKLADVNLGKVGEEYFVNMATFGVSMIVAQGVPHGLKQLFGRASYAIYSLVSILRHRPLTIDIETSHGHETYKTHQLCVANGSRHAGQQIAEDAHIDKNQLLAYSLGSSHRLTTFLSSLWLLLSAHLPAAKKGFIADSAMTIHLSRPQRIEIDGEIRSRQRHDRYEFSIAVDALRVFVPKEFNDQ